MSCFFFFPSMTTSYWWWGLTLRSSFFCFFFLFLWLFQWHLLGCHWRFPSWRTSSWLNPQLIQSILRVTHRIMSHWFQRSSWHKSSECFHSMSLDWPNCCQFGLRIEQIDFVPDLKRVFPCDFLWITSDVINITSKSLFFHLREEA